MKTIRCASVLFAISALAGPSVYADNLFNLFRKPDIEVITVTDVTPEGKLHPSPTPQNPVYYAAISLGFQDLGGMVAGEKVPPKDEMLRIITKVLASQNFLPFGENTPPPSLVLVLTWGTLYTDIEYGMNPNAPPRQRNRQQILKFIGGNKLGISDRDFDPLTPPLMGLTFLNYDARAFYEMAEEDFYMAIVAAYDFEAAKLKQRKLLWATKISCPSKGYWLSDVMPAMMTIAGPNIGRETDKPVWVNASSQYRPEVKIGDLKFLEYLEKGDLPILDVSPDQEKAKPAAKP